MSDPLVIAVDSSTSATKAVVVDKSGQVLSTGKADIDLLTPGMDMYEHDPVQWWESTETAISQACAALSDADRQRIKALCITHQRESFALVDEDGGALRPAILWLDSRAGDEIKEHGSDHIHELSGKPADTTPALYKIAWLKKHEPEVLTSAHKLVDVHAYLAHHLVGRWVSAVGSADTLNLLDIANVDYSDELLDIAGVTREQMAELAPSASIIDTIKKELTDSWGIPGDVVLVAGVGDGQAAGLGTSAIDEDVAYVNIGTSVVAGVHAFEYAYSPAYRTLLGGIPDSYVLEIVQNSGSVLANWFRKELGDPALDGGLDPELDAAAEALEPGTDGLLTVPYWNAVQSPHWDPFAKGIVLGFGSAHTRAHMYRSIIEGMAIELRGNLERVQESTGRKLRELRCTGGGSRNPLYRRIFADATGLPLVVSGVDEVSAQGAAMMAMAAIGAYPDVQSASEGMASFVDRTDPDPEAHEIYGEWAAIQQDIYPALADIFTRINSVTKRK
ncbi:xylulose kinase [Flaviflexus ciconiae]|uniref:Xylulose kinase n=2 Tax=Flaviflexus TaxID=1522056 RepID=A0A3Q9G245_9ACTO|nr:FGGY family carbohydrate kinase [Flaviflexus ciconiae]AZQ77205.1 xylulose kinase [Flaviflexus ciconiae]